MKLAHSFFWGVLFCQLSAAALLSPSAGAPTQQFGKLAIATPASVTAEGTNLKLLGRGVREKKVAFFTPSVYFAQAYANATLNASDSLEVSQAAVLAQPLKAIQLTFLRDVPAEKIRTAFAESLKENGIVLTNSSPESNVLSAIKEELKEGQTLSLVGSKIGDIESLALELPQGVTSVTGPSISTNFFKIWFGKTSEAKLRELQAKLVGKAAQ